jgi:hypothetical protein
MSPFPRIISESWPSLTLEPTLKHPTDVNPFNLGFPETLQKLVLKISIVRFLRNFSSTPNPIAEIEWTRRLPISNV